MSCRSLPSLLATLLLPVCLIAAAVAAAPNVLIVDLYLNGQHVGDTFVLRDDNGDFMIDESVLVKWEIRKPWPGSEEFRGTRYFSLGDMAGATASLEERAMRLDVSLPTTLMPERTVALADSDLRARRDGFGLFLDYQFNFQGYSGVGQNSAYAHLEPVVFGRYGSLSANTIYRRDSHDGIAGSNTLRPGLNVLELTFTRDDPENLRSFRAGDVFTRPGTFGRSLRMGGVQLATNFETQPQFITYPLPRFLGEASVPTALDIYVNGQLRQQASVEPGSYVLEDIPAINGMGQFQVVTRDALGQQQVFVQDFYTSPDLLRVGLSDYSITLGALRENYGLENFGYGDIAASGTWRFGWKEHMTVEGHAEVTGGLGVIAGATKYAIPAGGIISAGLGLSTGKIGTGGSWQVGFRQQSELLNFSVNLSGASKRFRMIEQLESTPKFQAFANAGKNLPGIGSIGLSLVHREFFARQRQMIVSANHSKSFNRRVIVTTHLSYIDAEIEDVSIGIRVSMPFGDRHHATGGYSRNHDRDQLNAEVIKSLPLGSGYGYRVGANAIDNSYLDAGLSLQNDVGTYLVDVRTSDSSGTAWQANAFGSLAYMSGVTSFTRQIRDAFAVVNVGNIEGVTVYAENIEVGKTDVNGQILVPGLHPYLRNDLRIEVDDLPMNTRVGEVETQAAPYYKSGVVVDFDVSISNNVLLRAVLPDGTPVPEGAYATINRLKKIYPVGRNGKLFLQGIDRSSLVTLRWRGLTCNLNVPFPDSSAAIAHLGDIVCDPKPVN